MKKFFSKNYLWLVSILFLLVVSACCYNKTVLGKENLEKEVTILIKHFELNCPIEGFTAKADWEYVSSYKYLSEEFMEKYWRYLDKFWISLDQNLSEEFMIRYWKELNKLNISLSQKISEDFILSHLEDFDKICIENILERKDLDLSDETRIYLMCLL